MPYATFKTEVDAPLNLLWELLIDKIENPQRYVAGVKTVNILEKNDQYVLRQMTTDKFTVKEKITWNNDTKEILFTLIDDPYFTGQVLNKIITSSDNNQPHQLEFTLDWKPLNPENEYSNLELSSAVEKAVLHTKMLAEQQKE